MRYDILHEGNHYSLYVNGQFHSSGDTVAELAREIDELEAERASA